MTNPHLCQEVSTPIGNLTLVSTEVGLRAVLWPNDGDRITLPRQMTASNSDPILCETATQLGQYFAKERTEFDLPLDLQGTDFQQQAWNALARIPYCLLYTSPSPRDLSTSRMPSSA